MGQRRGGRVDMRRRGVQEERETQHCPGHRPPAAGEEAPDRNDDSQQESKEGQKRLQDGGRRYTVPKLNTNGKQARTAPSAGGSVQTAEADPSP